MSSEEAVICRGAAAPAGKLLARQPKKTETEALNLTSNHIPSTDLLLDHRYHFD
jgi:hypothetical protein